MNETQVQFSALCSAVAECRKCDRMAESLRVLSPSAGPLDSEIMFIGEAPGRLGADSSGIPFHGDKAGRNFESLLEQVGIARAAVFVTNAALCNPKDEKGNNATPNRSEIDNCSGFLRQQIAIVNPKIIVTLGLQALNALRQIEHHDLALSQHVRTSHAWLGRTLIPAYHPGQRAMIHRSFANQLSDYRFIADVYRRLGQKGKPRSKSAMSSSMAVVAEGILKRLPLVSYFAMHKLAYMTEIEALKLFGRRATNSYYVRQKDGPYCIDLHIKKLQNALQSVRVTKEGEKLYLSLGSASKKNAAQLRFFEPPESIGSEIAGILDTVCGRYGGLPDDRLKTSVYLTSPMKTLLRLERQGLRSTYNAPIPFEAAVLRPQLPT